nr:hypothetical protein GTC16762_15020 [Pigmentibacter ruber]
MKILLDNSDGLTLLEFIILFPITIFLSFSIIEISRLYAFKLFLQSISNDISIFISHQKLKISEKNVPEIDFIKNSVKKNILNKIDNFPTYNLHDSVNYSNSIYLKAEFINSDNLSYPAGVYLKIYVCLPLLFPKLLNGYFDKSTSVGKQVKNTSFKNRNCLGHFFDYDTEDKNFYFRVRSASYVPWPASVNIFFKGLYVPNKFYGMEEINEKEKRNFFMQNIGKYL